MVRVSMMRMFLANMGLLLTLVTLNANADTRRHVLILDSFGNGVEPYHSVAASFKTKLAKELGEPVEFYEASLDLARFAEPTMEIPMVEFLASRFKDRRLDLIVPVGAPAVRFAGKYRERFFPETPILSQVAIPRQTPPEFLLPNATFAGQRIDIRGMVEDILQIRPDTTQIEVVFGASWIEKFWVNECRREFEVFSDQIRFTYLNDLSLDQILERCAKLPPHSFIIFVMMLIDASGIPYPNDEAFEHLHAAANAPILGYLDNSFGTGSIGGRLFQSSELGEHGALMAIRILRGEKPANIPPEILETTAPVYDWRELKRWGISQARLPVGSTIRFRQPTVWELYRWQILAAVVISLSEGFIIVLLVSTLVKRRRAERLLSKSEERFRHLIEQAPEAILVLDYDLDHFVDANAQAERLFGCSRQTLLASGPQQFYTPNQPDGQEWSLSFRENGKRALRGETVTIERTLCNALGRYRHCEVRLVRLPAEEHRLIRASFIDITERKQTENEVQSLRRDLAHGSRVASLGELMASLAHELNQPLAAIEVNAQTGLCLLESPNKDLGELREILTDIVSDDQRAGEIIRHLRTMLKNDTARQTIIHLNELVQDMLKLVRNDAVLNDISLVFNPEPDVPPVHGDRVQLLQVLLNLVLNAIDSIRDAGSVDRRILISTQAVPEGVQLSVRDSGPGIKAEMIDRIFQPFYSTKPKGMGMGLAICRSILEAHHGSIRAQNHPDGGVSFICVLPKHAGDGV